MVCSKTSCVLKKFKKQKKSRGRHWCYSACCSGREIPVQYARNRRALTPFDFTGREQIARDPGTHRTRITIDNGTVYSVFNGMTYACHIIQCHTIQYGPTISRHEVEEHYFLCPPSEMTETEAFKRNLCAVRFETTTMYYYDVRFIF